MMMRWGVGRVVLVESIIILAGILMVLAVFTESRAEDEATLELPPPATVEETVSPMDMSFYELVRRRPITSWLKDKLKDMRPSSVTRISTFSCGRITFSTKASIGATRKPGPEEAGWSISPAGCAIFLW